MALFINGYMMNVLADPEDSMRLAAMLLHQVQGCLRDMSFRALPDLLWTCAVLENLTVVMWNEVVAVLMEQHWEVRGCIRCRLSLLCSLHCSTQCVAA